MKILVVDDDLNLRKGLEVFLQNQGHQIDLADNGKNALVKFGEDKYDLIITDIQMPEMDGITLLEKLRQNSSNITVIVVTAFATIEKAVEAMKKGAADFLTKPLNLEELRLRINRIESTQKVIEENKALKSRLNKIDFPEIIGESPAIKEMMSLIKKISNDSDVPVMIYGKSGTGKELVARNIHKYSSRLNKPFVAINCAAIPDDLLESELFGYTKGAFTGAHQNKIGLIQSAEGGTLFLDEVGEMSERIQAKLLRVLQDHEIQPLGNTESRKVNIRVMGASNINLKEKIETGKFREDLYYRLNVVEIIVPPLSERINDIPILVEYFISKYSRDNLPNISFTNEAMTLLKHYSWPGNVRELENVIRMLNVIAAKPIIDSEDLPELFQNEKTSLETEVSDGSHYRYALNRAIAEFERDFISKKLSEYNWNISKTAEIIGLSRVSLYKKIKQYDIKADL
jgi:two-component system response regulator AtoC